MTSEGVKNNAEMREGVDNFVFNGYSSAQLFSKYPQHVESCYRYDLGANRT